MFGSRQFREIDLALRPLESPSSVQLTEAKQGTKKPGLGFGGLDPPRNMLGPTHNPNKFGFVQTPPPRNQILATSITRATLLSLGYLGASGGDGV